MCKTETWLTADVTNEALILLSYFIYQKHRKINDFKSRHGGVLNAVKSSLKHENVDISLIHDDTKKQAEKSNLSLKLKYKKLEVEVRKAIVNDLSVYETKIFESRQFSKTQKYLSSIRKNPHVPPIMFWKGMGLTPDKPKAESFNFFFASLFNQKTEIPTACS